MDGSTPPPTDTGGPSTGGPDRKPLHVVFVVDGSGSMAGERIGSLNWAAKSAVPAMREAAAEHPDVDVRVRVLRFADTADWIVAQPTPVRQFVWTNLAARGESAMGAALSLLAEAFRALDGDDPSLPPAVVVLFSDGYPSDDVEAGLTALQATRLGREAVKIAIAIGPDADFECLRAFIGTDAIKPLRANNADMLVSHFRWAASKPLAAAAAATGLGPGEVLSGSGAPQDETHDGLVW